MRSFRFLALSAFALLTGVGPAQAQKTQIPQAGGEEVQLLGAALQRMKDSLARQADRAEAERRLTAMVFEQLPDGLVVVDSELHVIESNRRFSRMIGVPTPAGRALYDLLRDRNLYDVFEKTLRTGETNESTVRLEDEIVWQVTASLAPPARKESRSLS